MLKDRVMAFTTQLTMSEKVQNAVSYQIDILDITNAQAVLMYLLFPDWQIGVEYKQNVICKDNGSLYRCNQTHTSSDDYNLSVASLWTKIEIAPDGIMIWHQSGGAHDAPNFGDNVHYPGADDPVYRSKMNGNTTIPGSDERYWELVEQ